MDINRYWLIGIDKINKNLSLKYLFYPNINYQLSNFIYFISLTLYLYHFHFILFLTNKSYLYLINRPVLSFIFILYPTKV